MRKTSRTGAVRPYIDAARTPNLTGEGGAATPRWERFVQCPGCGYDLATGDGERSCSWGDCPYQPAELDVLCPNCRFNFFTMQGNALCGKPGVCEHSAESRSHVENLRTWLSARV